MLRRAATQPSVIRSAGSSRVVSDHRFLTLLNASEFHPVQQRSEVLALLDLIRSRRYDSLLEIGTSNGGTSLLTSRALSRPATLTTVDINAGYDRDRLTKSLSRRVDGHLLIADSHDHRTVDLIRNEQKLGFDVVFIDGDHSYDGVRLDTEFFAPLARPGGILVFHDIQDARPSCPPSRHDAYVGGVPNWWRQISATVPRNAEVFVADDNQSGFGIGVIHLPNDAAELDALRDEWSALDNPL
ncbi:class I SAM-dependent methyltransferase [bacterium]|nr:class I SAM-dependent methyltransferase [bacterium]